MTPKVYLRRLNFTDGTSVALSANDIVVIVGPNNSGKSATLKAVLEKVSNPAFFSPVLSEVDAELVGSADDLKSWLEVSMRKRPNSQPNHPVYEGFGVSVMRSNAVHWWTNFPQSGLRDLAKPFVHLLNTEERLTAANPAASIAISKDPLSHPIHFLQRDDELERRLSGHFGRAFGQDLIVHRNAGSQVPLHCGKRPVPPSGGDRVSLEYVERLEELPTVHTQGDGIRSFVGVLLHASVGPESVLLIDEPEAFLHPPQARQLGRMLVSDKPEDRQVIIATHSGDVLRGILDADSTNVRILRIQREEAGCSVRELGADQIREIWKDPLLRYSNVLDGLFHEGVLITEGDADCRFYGAMIDAVVEAKNPLAPRPDLMCTHAGGKSRVPLIARALFELSVPIRIVVDFDVLNDEYPLRSIVDVVGPDWSDLKSSWRLVKSAVDAKKPELSSAEIVAAISDIISSVDEPIFPRSAIRNIQAVFRRASPWAGAKSSGSSIVPSGDPTKAYQRLKVLLESHGVFIVDVGELESFVRSVGGHGPAWVNEVLERDLLSDPELDSARTFAIKLLESLGSNKVLQESSASA